MALAPIVWPVLLLTSVLASPLSSGSPWATAAPQESAPGSQGDSDNAMDTGLFDRENLVAWCIVPFDAKKRTPAARAVMVKSLGLSRIAYDWRDEHVATFEFEGGVLGEAPAMGTFFPAARSRWGHPPTDSR